MTSFAQGTSVSVSRSRVEIEDLLTKWKASRIGVVTEERRAAVVFSIGQWHVRFIMPLPTDKDVKTTDARQSWRRAADGVIQQRIEQATRERWRALLLTIKAKLVSVENGVESFEEAFMAHLVLPGGQTVGQKALPGVLQAYETGTMPPLLGPGVGT